MTTPDNFTKDAILASLTPQNYRARLEYYRDRAKLDIVELSTLLGHENSEARVNVLLSKLAHVQEVVAFCEARLREHEANRRPLLVLRVLKGLRGWLVDEAINVKDSKGDSIVLRGGTRTGTMQGTRVTDADLHAAHKQNARILVRQFDGSLIEWHPLPAERRQHAASDAERIITRAVQEAMA